MSPPPPPSPRARARAPCFTNHGPEPSWDPLVALHSGHKRAVGVWERAGRTSLRALLWGCLSRDGPHLPPHSVHGLKARTSTPGSFPAPSVPGSWSAICWPLVLSFGLAVAKPRAPCSVYLWRQWTTDWPIYGGSTCA